MKKRSKLYQYIELLLRSDPMYRNSDKKTVWQVWYRQGLVKTGEMGQDYITSSEFMRAKSAGTILRTKRKIVENYKKKGVGHLVMATKEIEKTKRAKANYYQGEFVYHEKI